MNVPKNIFNENSGLELRQDDQDCKCQGARRKRQRKGGEKAKNKRQELEGVRQKGGN
jgi:hypothetical protein